MIILRNGMCVDPATGSQEIMDIAIKDDAICAMGKELDPGAVARSACSDIQIYDCEGLIIGPGLVDAHVHFRDPGFTHKEDIISGGQAAARGGVTSVIMMANTKPVIDNIDTLRYVLEKGKETGINVYSSASVTEGLKGEKLTDMRALKDAGAVAFTDDGIPILSEEMATEAMKKAAELGTILSFHEEDPQYITNNGINHGKASEHFGLGGSDRMAEISMIERDIKLAVITGAKINIQHISTAEGVDAVRKAKAEGYGDIIHAEATPHHLSMTEDDTIRYGTNAKMNPPLRLKTDRDAVIQGLVDGTIDCIATDHAPHAFEEKNQPIDKAPSGIIGLETAFSVSYNALIRTNKMSLLQLFCKMSLNPARLYGINAGQLAIYRTADIMVFDPNKIHFYDKSRSKSFNTPLANSTITGDVVATISRGRLVYNGMNERLSEI